MAHESPRVGLPINCQSFCFIFNPAPRAHISQWRRLEACLQCTWEYFRFLSLPLLKQGWTFPVKRKRTNNPPFWWFFGWCKTQACSRFHFLSLSSGIPERSSPSEEKQTPATFFRPFNVTLMWHKLFVTCLSSSGEHKDYCFWLCVEYFGHFTPVIHIDPSLSIQQREGRVIFFSVNCTNFPVNGQICDCPIYTKDRLPTNCSHEDRFMNSHRRVLPMNDTDFKLNSHIWE